MKILQQATLEASHNKKLREKLEEVDTDNCMYHCTVCTKVIACLVLCRVYNEHGYVHGTLCYKFKIFILAITDIFSAFFLSNTCFLLAATIAVTLISATPFIFCN